MKYVKAYFGKVRCSDGSQSASSALRKLPPKRPLVYKLSSSVELHLSRGDITQVECDVIVNAANEQMLGGGGVDGAIHRAAGPKLRAECFKHQPVNDSTSTRCPAGEARLTGGYELPAKFVVHTVGPRYWEYGTAQEAEAVLRNCHMSCFDCAMNEGVQSIAFPAISCGVYGFPVPAASNIAIKASQEVAQKPSELKVIQFVLHDQLAWNTFRRTAAALLGPMVSGPENEGMPKEAPPERASTSWRNEGLSDAATEWDTIKEASPHGAPSATRASPPDGGTPDSDRQQWRHGSGDDPRGGETEPHGLQAHAGDGRVEGGPMTRSPNAQPPGGGPAESGAAPLDNPGSGRDSWTADKTANRTAWNHSPPTPATPEEQIWKDTWPSLGATPAETHQQATKSSQRTDMPHQQEKKTQQAAGAAIASEPLAKMASVESPIQVVSPSVRESPPDRDAAATDAPPANSEGRSAAASLTDADDRLDRPTVGQLEAVSSFDTAENRLPDQRSFVACPGSHEVSSPPGRLDGSSGGMTDGRALVARDAALQGKRIEDLQSSEEAGMEATSSSDNVRPSTTPRHSSSADDVRAPMDIDGGSGCRPGAEEQPSEDPSLVAFDNSPSPQLHKKPRPAVSRSDSLTKLTT